ncbi:DeoR/GlpR transcriptional regulator [Nocardioides dongxiaopingii]|uniref:DeoR/GlpR family DNA-binding transcription regulator n=1 Tax=Nocardioides TaxID=1839 RepID=UPI0010C766E5|nr:MULTISPECIES: DeoR/GlpR family DNA-binding transcription regulator [Nocardioides]QCW51274.1 DeoR/GlpR transcriptional regulator [Nocardioides sp. S-1144]
MYAEERQQAMSRLITERRRVSVTALAEQYDVTTETVRRDLSQLERLGLVRRVHGGAVPADALATTEAALGDRDRLNTDLKDLIAKAALALLPADGSTIILDAGSTTSRLAGALPQDRRLVVFTHAVPVASRLATLPLVELHLLPGRVRTATHAAVGPDTVAALGMLRADIAFLGSNALSVGHGLSTPDADEAATKRAVVAAAQQVVALVDSTKIGHDSAIRFAALSEVDIVVTDAAIEPSDRRAIERAGTEVLVA